jgi:DNA invertase Pin-like site-specific DNA recombinase
MATAIYRRVSSVQQTTAAQDTDLNAYRAGLVAKGETVLEFEDHFTGKTLNRPGWSKLWQTVLAGQVDKIIVWRLDRLGRTVSGLSHLFEEITAREVTLISLRDCIDLSTAAGRLMCHVLASVAAYETEIRSERQLAGIAAAQADIKAGRRRRYGSGRKPGLSIAPAVQQAIRAMKEQGKPITEIAAVTRLSRPTIYKVLACVA